MERMRILAGAFARAFLRNLADRDGIAEEVAQDVVTTLSRMQERTPISSDIELRRLTWTIARRRSIDARRRAQRRGRRLETRMLGREGIDPIAELASASRTPSSLAARRELFNELLAETAYLPKRQRDALLLYFLGGMTSEEIGVVVGTSRTGAANLVHRATLALQARWRERSLEAKVPHSCGEG